MTTTNNASNNNAPFYRVTWADRRDNGNSAYFEDFPAEPNARWAASFGEVVSITVIFPGNGAEYRLPL